MGSVTNRRTRTWLTTPLMVSVFFLFAAIAPENCSCPGGDDDDAVDDDDNDDNDDVADDDDDVADDDDVGDDDDDVKPFKLGGDVYIVPIYYEPNEDGIWTRMELEWTEVHPDGYQYGRIYVGVVASFEDGSTPMFHYTSPTMPADPKNDPTPYLFDPGCWPLEEIAVLAIADTWYDTIISPWDSSNFHADLVDTTGDPVLDANVFIDMEFVWNGHAWVPGHHSYGGGGGGGGGDDDDDGGGGDDDDDGGGGGDDDDDDGGGGGGGGWGPGNFPGDPNCPLVIGGDIYLYDSPHTISTGNSLVAVYDETFMGPYWFDFPGMLDGGAQKTHLPWQLDINCSFVANMRGAWDWNNNGLFEPADDWGATVDGVGDAEINPWTFAEEDILDMLVEVPVGTAEIPLPEPYVKISGVVITDGTFEFADLPGDARMAVFAAKQDDLVNAPLELLINGGYIWSFDAIFGINAMGDAIPFEVYGNPYSTVWLNAGIDVDGDGNHEIEYDVEPVAVHLTDEDEVRTVHMSYLP